MDSAPDFRAEYVQEECYDFVGVGYIAAPSDAVVEAEIMFLLYLYLVLPGVSQLQDGVRDVVALGVASKNVLYDIRPGGDASIVPGRHSYPTSYWLTEKPSKNDVRVMNACA